MKYARVWPGPVRVIGRVAHHLAWRRKTCQMYAINLHVVYMILWLYDPRGVWFYDYTIHVLRTCRDRQNHLFCVPFGHRMLQSIEALFMNLCDMSLALTLSFKKLMPHPITGRSLLGSHHVTNVCVRLCENVGPRAYLVSGCLRYASGVRALAWIASAGTWGKRNHSADSAGTAMPLWADGWCTHCRIADTMSVNVNCMW